MNRNGEHGSRDINRRELKTKRMQLEEIAREIEENPASYELYGMTYDQAVELYFQIAEQHKVPAELASRIRNQIRLELDEEE